MRKKTSIIWTTPHADLQNLLNECSSVVDILKRLGFEGYNGNHRTLTRRISVEKFDLVKFEENKKANKASHIINAQLKNCKPDNEIFVKDSTYAGTTQIKKRLVKLGMDYKCVECGIGIYYNNKPISLQLDHINGINNDNRLENLRFLCPNCHSQTPTFSGRRKAIKSNPIHDFLLSVKKERKKPVRKKKINWPSQEELKKVLWEKPTTTLAKELGVSDVAISKHIKELGLTKPPRGYWSKLVRQ